VDIILITFETIYNATIGMEGASLPRYLLRKSDGDAGYSELVLAVDDLFEQLNRILEGDNPPGFPYLSNEDLLCIFASYDSIQQVLCRAAFESGRAVGAGKMGAGFPLDDEEAFDLVYSCILGELVSVPDFMEPILEFVPTAEYDELYEQVYAARLRIATELSSGKEPRICFDLVDHIERTHRALCRKLYLYGTRLERRRAYQRNKKRR